MAHRPEEKESLWLLTASPAIWAGHFLLSYLTAAVWCAKVAGRGGSLGGARMAIVAYTVLALVGIGIIGRIGLQRHGHGPATASHELDTPGDRHRFLGLATLLLSALSGVAVIYSSLVAIIFETCD